MKTNLLLLGMNRLVFRPRPDKTFYKVLKRTELWLFCLIAFFFLLCFIVKYLLNALPASILYFASHYCCVFFYDRGWWRQILSTTVRSLWQEPLILLEAQCVQFNDHIISLWFDTFDCSPTLTQALGFPGTFNSDHRYNAIQKRVVPLFIEKQQAFFWPVEMKC